MAIILSNAWEIWCVLPVGKWKGITMAEELDTGGLVARVKAILIDPASEWPRIAAEHTSTKDVLISYVIPLAAIGPVAVFIGGQLFGYGAFGFNFRIPLVSALGAMVTSYALSLVMLFVLSAITNILAPRFGGIADSTRAFKLVAYSFSASWVASALGVLSLAPLGAILGLYGIYLFHSGTGPVMRVPQDKATAFTAVTFVAAVIAGIMVMQLNSMLRFGQPG